MTTDELINAKFDTILERLDAFVKDVERITTKTMENSDEQRNKDSN